MPLLLMSFFGLLRGGREQRAGVYCQSCANEITDVGGDVSSTGRIYCHGYKGDSDTRCLDAEMFIQMQDGGVAAPVFFESRSARQVQRDIKRGRLVEYGKLEEPVEHPPMRTVASSSD